MQKTGLNINFTGLLLQLNIIILLVAMSIIVFFIVHSPYSVPIIIGMLILALILSLDFFKKYKDTKKWLDKQPEKDKKDDSTSENDKINSVG